MNEKAIRVFKELMLKKGCISRTDDHELWMAYDETAVRDALQTLEEELDFELYRAGDRLYLLPNQGNELFAQSNMDFRRAFGDSELRIADLYLLNYIAVYLLYTIFGGDGSDPQTREFITKAEFLAELTRHCEQVHLSEKAVNEETYSVDFMKLSEQWLGKQEGEAESLKMDTMNGCLNRVLVRLKREELFIVEEDRIMPTRKCKDLMPFFLRKERITAIHTYLAGGKEDAADYKAENR